MKSRNEQIISWNLTVKYYMMLKGKIDWNAISLAEVRFVVCLQLKLYEKISSPHVHVFTEIGKDIL